MIRAIVRNELLKSVHRLAFWIVFIVFAFGTSMDYIQSYLRAQGDPDRHFALPEAWATILGNDPEVLFIFGGVLLILLVANEFTWRTARQNVIDGLSKEQFFLGKVLLIPLIVAVFLGFRVILGGGLAAAGSADGWVMGGPAWSALAGLTVAFVGSLAVTLFIALAVRSGGAGMGVWLLYFALVENLVAQGLVRLSSSLEAVVKFLPIHVFSALTRYIQHDPAAFQRAVAHAVEQHHEPPGIWDAGTLWLTAAAWIVAILGGAFVWFRKRDL
jgi:ABC-2 type transport system permease protein